VYQNVLIMYEVLHSGDHTITPLAIYVHISVLHDCFLLAENTQGNKITFNLLNFIHLCVHYCSDYKSIQIHLVIGFPLDVSHINTIRRHADSLQCYMSGLNPHMPYNLMSDHVML